MNPVDTIYRVPWSQQLTDADTALYSLMNYFKGWDPTLKTTVLAAPENITISDDSLRWNTVAGARGYVILRNDSATGFSVTNAFYTGGRTHEIYRIKSVNSFGALSDASEMAVVTGIPDIDNILPGDDAVCFNHGVLYLPENESVKIYKITGELVKTYFYSQSIHLEDLVPGVYIIRVVLDKHGKSITQKIINAAL